VLAPSASEISQQQQQPMQQQQQPWQQQQQPWQQQQQPSGRGAAQLGRRLGERESSARRAPARLRL
jgi:hypothetical protein